MRSDSTDGVEEGDLREKEERTDRSGSLEVWAKGRGVRINPSFNKYSLSTYYMLNTVLHANTGITRRVILPH